MSSVMSTPYALPAGPTRRADSSTSIPPPDPRSRTISPGRRSMSAVGFPQPSDAFSAASGTAPRSASEYRSDVISSSARPPAQQLSAAGVVAAWRAAAPYFS